MKNIASYLQHLVLPLCLSATALVAAPIVAHASGAAQARISGEISSSRMTPLPNSKQTLATPELETGRLASTTKLEGVTLHFSRSQSQQADLEKLMAAQQDPSSPQYHKWLTPEQFGARFGLADSDIAQVQSWLEQQGFAVIDVARGKSFIRFSGTAAQVERAFATELHTYNLTYQGNVEKHFAPSTAISVPSAIAGVVDSLTNLTDIRPRAKLVSHRAVSKPNFTWNFNGNSYVFFAPGDIYTQYDLQKAYNGGNNGTGQTIAIVGQSDVAFSDIEAFQTAAGLPIKDPTRVLVPGTGTAGNISSGDESESDLDLEWSGAIAKGAEIKFVYVGTTVNHSAFDSIQYAIDENLATVISSSYGNCEAEISQFTAQLTSIESSLQEAGLQGQTVLSASGDSGSTDCYGNTDLGTAQENLAVDYPASSAYVTGVGGAQVSSANSAYLTAGSAYWAASTGSASAPSLLQYVPEVAWNEDGETGCNASNCIASGGGGASTLFTKPAWQTGVTGIPSANNRYVPDVSLQASLGTPGYVFCTSDQSFWDTQDGQVASCNNGFLDASSTFPTAAGGTSFAAPIFAGMVAIINQQQGYTTGQGLINPTLYTLASKSSTYASAFHDITAGTNACTASSTYCNSNGKSGFTATTGYDQATGLGTVDFFNLAAAWPAVTGPVLIGTTTTVTPSNTAPAIGASVSFTISVTATDGSTPAGTVSISVDGGTAITGNTLTSNGTFVYTTTFSTAGSHTVLATYSGDATHATSNGSATVTVPGTSSGSGTFSLTSTNITVTQGNTGSSTITVTPAGGYTGTVTFALSTGSTTLSNLSCVSLSNAVVSGTAPVSTTLSIDTNGADCSTNAALKGQRRIVKASGFGQGASGLGGVITFGALFAGLLLVGFVGRSSEKLRVLVCVALLATFGFAMSGCGGSSNSNSLLVPKGTYTVQVTGSDSASATIPTATTTVTLTVQ